jgi:hypothetical protein
VYGGPLELEKASAQALNDTSMTFTFSQNFLSFKKFDCATEEKFMLSFPKMTLMIIWKPN